MPRKAKPEDCKDCKTNEKRICFHCKRSGCTTCMKTVCGDCDVRMCNQCKDDDNVMCGCYGECTSCGKNVDRGEDGWPCSTCKQWLCGKCRPKNKGCKECYDED